ncbi:cell division protein FtsL [Mesobacterium pallidum]|uniref:cell division protein FtsL n=1 Tax=Mesobacterium pallidum TaxID=2872037 RepID=UPI001EE36669|nr:cell division protein FtsL [Mesobacterium pallidum]
MKSMLYVMTALAVMALAFWAYRENYQTQAALDEVRDLRQEIGATRGELGVLRAEWAYLNRPDRLRELAGLNFPDLGLLPLRPDQFGRVDQVAFPSPVEELGPILEPIDLTSMNADAEVTE